MSTIVTRAGKGSPLSHNEADANWTNLNTDKLEKDGSIALTGDLALGTNKVTGVGDPTAAQDAATKTYVDTADATKLPLAGGAMSGAITTASGNLIVDPATQILEVKGNGSSVEGQIQLNCHANSHGQIIKAQPHSAGITNTMLLPTGASSTLVSEVSASAFTNKTGNISQWTNDSNYLLNIVEDTTPQLGGTLDTNNNTVTNALGDVKINKTLMDQTHSDYSLTIVNDDNSGLGLRIKAGNSDSGTYGSLAILSVADKSNDNKFIVKASGEVVSYYNHTIKDVLISDSSISTLNNGDNLNITTNAGTLSLNSLNWPAADGTSGQILQTNGSGQLSFVTNSGGSGIAAVVDDTTPQLGGTLDQNGQNITDASRNYQIIGAPADPTSSGFDAFGGTNAGRAHGPATVSVIDTNQSDRIYTNIRAASVQLDADQSGNGGRIRHNFTEGNLITDGFDLTASGFGSGHHGQWMTSNVSNNHASNAATVTDSNTLSIVPQYTGSQTLTVTNGVGVSVQAYKQSASQTVTDFIGYQYENPIGNATNFGSSNHWSFKSNSSTAKLQNDGPAILSGLNYPTSDGSADQVLKTDGSGNLSFATVSGSSFNGNLAGNDLTDSTQDITIKPTGSTQAELKILDTGNDSMKLQLIGINTDAVGGQIDAIDQTGARANITFTGKQTDFDSNGGSVRFKTNATSETIRFLPAQGAASANDLEISSDGLGSINVISNGNVSFGTAAAQVSMPGGTQRIQLNKLVEMPLYTTTERNALGTVTQGSVLFNTTTDKLQVYANGAWVNLH